MPVSPYIKNPKPLPPTDSEMLRKAVIKELQRRGEKIEVVSPEERQRRTEEIIKCAKDCVYWIKTHVKTHDPREANSFIPFDLFPRQVELIHWLDERLKTQTAGCVEKSKDTGVSWVLCAWLLHKWLFWEGFAGGVGSRKLEYVDSKGDPKCLFEKFRIILKRLPEWMRPPGFSEAKCDMENRLINPKHSATIIGEGGTNIGRGGRTTVYFVDEYNFLEKPELADASLADNTYVQLYIGTPNGMVGIYTKRGTWPTFTFHWIDDPRKWHWTEHRREGNVVAEGTGRHPTAAVPTCDTYPTKTPGGNIVRYKWYEERKFKYRDQPWILKQETDIDYIGSGFPLFDREFLMRLHEKSKKIVPRWEESAGSRSEGLSGAWSGTLKTFKTPEFGNRYVVFADVAEGESMNTGGDPDWSKAHVYDTETWEQVAWYKSRCDTHAYGIDLAVIGETYNFAEIVVERTGPGISTLNTLVQEIGYPSVWGQWTQSGEIKHGFMATAKTKSECEQELRGIIADMKDGFDGFTWNEPETIEEMIHFTVNENGRAQAEPGWHDDEVTCVKMAALLLPQMTSRRKMLQSKPPEPKIPYRVGASRAGGRK